MKKYLALLLSVSTLFCLAACAAETGKPGESAGDEPTAAPEEKFYVCSMDGCSRHSGSEQLLETEDLIYYLCVTRVTHEPIKCKVWFSDKKNRDWLPLCGRPDCMHDDKNCNALLEGNTGSKIWLYGRHIYYVSDYESLWRMALDGSAHEKVLDFEFESPDYVGSFYFHDKYLVLNSVGFSEDDPDREVGEPHIFILDLSLDKPVLRETALAEGPEGRKTTGYPLAGEGKELYTVLDDCTLMRFDLEEASLTKVCVLPFYPTEYGTRIAGDKIFFYEPWDAGMAVTVDRNSGEIAEIKRTEPAAECWLQVCGEYLIGNDPESGDVFIYDSGCEFVASVPSPEGVGTMFPSWNLNGIVYGYEYVDGSESINDPPQWYLDLSELGTDHFAWRRWAPEN